MTPTHPNSNDKPGKISGSGGKARRSRLNLVGDAAAEIDEHSVFNTPAEVAAAFPEGTVGADVRSISEQTYGSGSDALLSGTPLNEPPTGEAAAVAKVRASDLLVELREISAQVNRMMSQVDRAIHRLGVHAGEPLRR